MITGINFVLGSLRQKHKPSKKQRAKKPILVKMSFDFFIIVIVIGLHLIDMYIFFIYALFIYAPWSYDDKLSYTLKKK